MQEVKGGRTHNSKLLSEGSSVMRQVHIGPIHYDNRFGLGDGVKGWRGLDWNLQLRPDLDYEFKFNNFQPLVPKSADGIIGFRNLWDGNDQTIRLRALGAAPVPGVLEQNVYAGLNGVVYLNAFATGADLVIAFSRTQMLKLIRLRSYPRNRDLTFQFEADFGGSQVHRGYEKGVFEYELDTTREKLFSSDKNTYFGSDGNFTRLNAFRAWDETHDLERVIPGRFYRDGSRYLFEKRIPQAFLEKAQGTIFTDATLNQTSEAGDGRVFAFDDTWDTNHDALTGTVSGTATSALVGCVDQGSGNYAIHRMFLPFDTSSIGAGATVTATTLDCIVEETKSNTDNDGDDWINIVQTTQASTASLAAGDYDACGDSIDNPTEGATRIDIGDSAATNGTDTFTLDATGRGWVSVTGDTLLGIREGHDAIDSVVAGNNRVFYRMSEHATDDPVLNVTYTPPGGPRGPLGQPLHGPLFGPVGP